LKNIIERFNSIHSLKSNLEREIEDIQEKIQEYSNMLGEKIRSNEESSADDPDFLALKAKLDGTSDKKSEEIKPNEKSDDNNKQKKLEKIKDVKKIADKKKKSKKGVSDKWYNLNEILVYNGIGLKGELELYFKAIDELKSKLENHQRTLATLNNVIEKGLKEDMGCIAFRGSEGLLEISFIKSTGFRENFSLKSIYSGTAIPVENIIKVGV
jgi:chromosome segregation ATPase